MYFTMCTYNVRIDDAVMSRVRPHFKGEDAMQQWMEQQLQKVLMDYIDLSEKRLSARHAIELMRMQSEQNGNSEMTLDDINEEIRQVRSRKKC